MKPMTGFYIRFLMIRVGDWRLVTGIVSSGDLSNDMLKMPFRIVQLKGER